MSKRICMLVFLLLSGSSMIAQGLVVRPGPAVAERREDYDRAVAAWRETSRDLEKEFLKQPAEKAILWIDRSSEKAMAVVAARDAYYSAITEQIRNQVSLLHAGHTFPADDFQRATSRTLATLSSDRKRLAGMKLKDDGRPETTILNEQTDRQIEMIRDLEDNLRDQVVAVDSVSESAKSLEDSKISLLKSLEEVMQLISDQAERDREETSLWQTYYRSLKELVEAQRPTVPAEKKVESPRRQP